MDIELKIDINGIHKKFSEYGQNAKEWQRKCGLLLKDIERFEIWKKKGFFSIYIYAAKLAGMNKVQVDEALRISKKIEGKPALIAVAEKKGLYAVRPVASIATAETDKYWAKYAMEMPKNELEILVKSQIEQRKNLVEEKDKEGCRLFELFDHRKANKLEIFTLNLKPEIISKLQKFCKGDWNEFMAKLIELYEKNLIQELQKEKPAPVKTESRHIPKEISDYVIKCSNGKCEFPNCGKKYDHLHHTNRFSSNRVHDPDQIIALCEAHHSLAHRGMIANEDKAIENWVLQSGPDFSNLQTSLNWYVDQQVQLNRHR